MKKANLILLLAIGCCFTTMAQTDMTDLITNSDFEDGVTGWKTDGLGPQSNNDFKKKHGKTYVETWTGWGGTVADRSIQQILTNLPIGVYTITAVGQNIQQETPKVVQTGAWIFAGNNAVEFSQPGDYSVTTTVGDGTLTIGARTRKATGNWVCVDYFRLTYTIVADSVQPFVKQLIAEAEQVDLHQTSEAQTELDAAKALLQTYVDSQETEGLPEAMERLKTAIRAYRYSLASEDNPFDMTYAIVNPNFEENGTRGWTVDGMGTQGNDVFSIKNGSTYVERWTDRGNAVGNGSVRQTLTNLPAGNYRLTAVAQNIQENSPQSRYKGAWIFAGDQRTAVNVRKQYEVQFTCIAGEAEIGFVAEDAKGNWIAVDDFHLYYIGSSAETNKAQLTQLIETAQVLQDKKMSADSLAVLNAAIAEAQQSDIGNDAARFQAAALALNKAIAMAESSIAAYERLNKAITEAEKVEAAGGTEGQDSFVQSMNDVRSLYDSNNATNAAIDAAIEALNRAVFVYYIANGSGTAPAVKTHPEVIYGCKAAVGRLTVSGSNLLESGFCWSTEPEPTVLDNRSSFYYEFNGKVFLMSDLQPSTTYYVRAYAISKKYAVGYGKVVRIITLPEAHVTYKYNMAAPDEATNERIDNACKTAVDYLNTWTSISGFNPSVNYDAGEDGAHGSYGGWITLGPGFTQNPGTVMHEMGHGIGVGQHWRYTSWDSPLHPTMYWTGERANRVFKFFENRPDEYNADGTLAHSHSIADGDRVHVCYGLSGVTAPIDLLRQAAFYQGMYEDGMPAVGDGAAPFYAFECEDSTKYYLTNEKNKPGVSYLMSTDAGRVSYKTNTVESPTDDDAYAWYIRFDPMTAMYHLRNVKTDRYITFNGSSFATKSTTSLTRSEDLQLMPARQLMTFQSDEEKLTIKPYWIARGNRVEDPEVLTSSSGVSVTASKLNFYDTATNQHWAILTAEQVQQIQLLTDIREVSSEQPTEHNYIYDLQGRRVSGEMVNGKSLNSRLPRGLYIINERKILVR